jgi:hypothetical protein
MTNADKEMGRSHPKQTNRQFNVELLSNKVFRLVIGTLYNNLKQKISIQRSGYSPALDGRASSLR